MTESQVKRVEIALLSEVKDNIKNASMTLLEVVMNNGHTSTSIETAFNGLLAANAVTANLINRLSEQE